MHKVVSCGDVAGCGVVFLRSERVSRVEGPDLGVSDATYDFRHEDVPELAPLAGVFAEVGVAAVAV